MAPLSVSVPQQWDGLLLGHPRRCSPPRSCPAHIPSLTARFDNATSCKEVPGECTLDNDGFCWSIENGTLCVYKDAQGMPVPIATVGSNGYKAGSKAVVRGRWRGRCQQWFVGGWKGQADVSAWREKAMEQNIMRACAPSHTYTPWRRCSVACCSLRCAQVTTLPPVSFENAPRCEAGLETRKDEDESGRYWGWEVGAWGVGVACLPACLPCPSLSATHTHTHTHACAAERSVLRIQGG